MNFIGLQVFGILFVDASERRRMRGLEGECGTKVR